ncbi:SKP1-like protein 1 [Cornus florida]|uniref:SKP1-like protein 1 n=1 Tax=Cornus florida TaxID=4283 RepID=UPI002897FA17|nr:SKP1-like protein 1 [Cornus florida]XP_059653959.1 SKP1-like protein 1 [Cornus florida]XP_059653960.1 SKP1-like protein 1 [Cornus florida]
MATSKTITLTSLDGKTFEVEEATAKVSEFLKNLIEDFDHGDHKFPLPVDSETLAKVMEYCKKNAETPNSGDKNAVDDELKNFDADFIKNIDLDTIYDLVQVAKYLVIRGLLDLTGQALADILKGKTPEEIRRTFNIKNDFIPEEEDEVHEESD